ncbi:MAG TPA: ATP-dependent Clp protease proteolytic subunit [Candidatus Paceibacterota bacterium]
MSTSSPLSRKNDRSVRSITRTQLESESIVSPIAPLQTPVRPDRLVEWFGGVNYGALERTLTGIKSMMNSSADEITLLVSSFGGATGVAMTFYDAITGWLNPNLVTIGSGDVDSSGVIVFLAGRRRYLTRNTTLLLHLAGRTLEKDVRHSSADLESMVKEDKLKDEQYARVVAEACGGTITAEYVLDLMKKNTLLTAEEAVAMGMAHGIV